MEKFEEYLVRRLARFVLDLKSIIFKTIKKAV